MIIIRIKLTDEVDVLIFEMISFSFGVKTSGDRDDELRGPVDC